MKSNKSLRTELVKWLLALFTIDFGILTCAIISNNVEHLMPQDDLDRFARHYPNQFKVYYVLNEVCVSENTHFFLLMWPCTVQLLSNIPSSEVNHKWSCIG